VEPEPGQRGGLLGFRQLAAQDRGDVGLLVGRIAECGEQPRHRGGVLDQIERELDLARVAQAPGEHPPAGVVVGHDLGLQPALELEHVLGVAQPAIRVPQREVLVVGDEPREQQRIERGQRAAQLQRRPLAGVDQLQRLDEELDLADPALAVLEVELARAGPPKGNPRRKVIPPKGDPRRKVIPILAALRTGIDRFGSGPILAALRTGIDRFGSGLARPHQLALDPAVQVADLVDHRR
jgi:hypothetical protein